MKIMLLIEIMGYFGVLALQAIWFIRGELTEHRFALFQVAALTLIMITVGLEAYLSSHYTFGLVVGSILTVVFALTGYPIAKWIYRQVFPK